MKTKNAVKSINKLCESCVEACKQTSDAVIVKCPQYRRATAQEKTRVMQANSGNVISD